jgi:hypothetical protein
MIRQVWQHTFMHVCQLSAQGSLPQQPQLDMQFVDSATMTAWEVSITPVSSKSTFAASSLRKDFLLAICVSPSAHVTAVGCSIFRPDLMMAAYPKTCPSS